MSENKHTDGPWMVHPYIANYGPHNKGLDVGPPGIAVCTVIGAFERKQPGPEAEANAKLIAAAPELFEVLKDLRVEVDAMANLTGWSGYGARDRADALLKALK